MLRRILKLATACTLALGLCFIGHAPSADAAGLLMADGGFGGQLEIKQHAVHVTINNGVAVTEVTQVFLNTENRVVEALYTFPVPKGASVGNFSMIIGGKEMIGEVVEKKRAREIYESYKQTRRDPGLLEQVDYKRFEMRVFPIAAGAEQQVSITYSQELDFDHDWASYVYPLNTVTRSGAEQTTTGKLSLTVDVKSEVPIAELESPSHGEQFVVAEHDEHYFRTSLETDGGDLSRDFVVAYRLERPKTGFDVITSKQSGEDGYFLLTLTAGKELEALEQGMDYVFIIDVSGSMAHDGKLSLSRGSVSAFIEALGEEDRFEVVAFNIAPTTLFNQARAVTDEAKLDAIRFLESQQARGGTMLRPALNTAYRYQDSDRTLNVVVLSDGMTEQREQQELLELIGQRPAGSRVFCVGVGNEVNRPLLSQLAADAGGLAAFISQGDDFNRQAQAFRRKLMRPAATGLKIDFSGVEVYDVEPYPDAALPNLYHGSPLRVYGRYKRGGTAAVATRGEVLGSPFQQSVEIDLPKVDDANPQIERMWAWHRVQRLLDQSRRDGNNLSVTDEIVSLCEEYSIVSEYASFIVLENDGEYQRWKIERRNAVRIGRDRAAQERVRRELEQLRDKAIARLGPQSTDRAVPEQVAVNTPSRPTSPTQSPAASPSPRRSRGPNLDFSPTGGGGGGGGAIDPITGALLLSLGGAYAAAGRRRRKNRRS